MITRLPAEWENQDCIVLAWPSKKTDWKENIKEVKKTYIKIIEEIADHELVLLIAPNSKVISQFDEKIIKNIKIITSPYNDTWTRDYVGISVVKENKSYLINFEFNGWGKKFDYGMDNAVNLKIESEGILSNQLKSNPLILEGGAIESNGSGLLLTTSNCLLNANRNFFLSKNEIEEILKSSLGSKSIIWLNSGHIEGDDTDSHIDTLVRFCDKNTIVYALDKSYELTAMEKELKKNFEEKNFNLIPVPQPKPIIWKNKRLPASYVNFLITNEKVLVPIYNDKNDQLVLNIFKKIFKNKKVVVGIDCNELIKQNGSLHCITMHITKGTLSPNLYEERN